MRKCEQLFVYIYILNRRQEQKGLVLFILFSNAPVMHFDKLRIGSTESFKRFCSNERFIRETKVTSETHLRAANGELLWVRDV